MWILAPLLLKSLQMTSFTCPKDISPSPTLFFSHIHKYILHLAKSFSLSKTLWPPTASHREWMTAVAYIPIPTRQATNIIPTAEQVWDQEEETENYSVHFSSKIFFA